MNYGMPYKGSKSKMAEWIIDILPGGKVLVDAFGGGGAISHCAVLSGKWEKVIYNELEPLIAKAFSMAAHGKFKGERRWISREEFNLLKDSDPYAAICFSFGNDLKTYCYGKDIEEGKRLLHELIFEEDVQKRRLCWHKMITFLQRLQSLQSLQSLERLQSLESLESLERLQSLEIHNMSYECLEIPDGAIIYCDIPYKDTNDYISEFNHEKFYDWCRNNKNLVFISEYSMPNDFHLVDQIEKRTTLSSTNNNTKTIERLYCNKPFKRPKQVTLFDFLKEDENDTL